MTTKTQLIPACAGKTWCPEGGPCHGEAHPRVCGENSDFRGSAWCGAGSSPRVRGKLPAQPRDHRRPGLIPACAGKTATTGTTVARWRAHPRVCGENGPELPRRGAPRAHPRVCGENTPGVSHPPRSYGSSPRVRGKPASTTPAWTPPRLIPACAGKTPATRPAASSAGAHPRVCGENPRGRRIGQHMQGSSPRVRGKPGGRGRHALPAGLIPACAGKTSRRPSTAPASRAHPRVCGENILTNLAKAVRKGSSPRVRGKLVVVRRRGLSPRLIPACAGKTFHVQRLRRRVAAHPRVCGENSADFTMRIRDGGSSPRVRGKPSTFNDSGGVSRLIPACAGKTARTSRCGSGTAAHPRVCGENPGGVGVGGGDDGSSPRVRGKRRRRGRLRDRMGLIPACAGKTRP